MNCNVLLDRENECSYHGAMYIHRTPTPLEKLTQMGDVTLFEPAGDQPTLEQSKRVPYQSQSVAECVNHLKTPFGDKAVLKTMVTTACEKNCFYCPFRAGRSKTERLTFKPDELAGLFNTMQRSKTVDGLFLSSGIIKGGVTTQDKIIDTAEIIRRKYRYRGYIHLKIMPGAEYEQLRRAMQLADRVSINLEGPTEARLQALAPKKDFDGELLTRLQWAAQIRQAATGKIASVVTQFVVGAVGDTDVELLSLSDQLYQRLGLARAYYSAFSPVVQTPFEGLTATPAQRELRLYQSSFLLRDYGWDVEDLPFEANGNLRQDVDPKQAWADAHLVHAPVELMTAEREMLLRVPGIGPKGATALIEARRTRNLQELSQLRQLGIRAPENSAPYILLNGRRPLVQTSLF